MIGIGLSIANTHYNPGASGPAVLPVAPAARWHPGHSNVTLASGRVAAASDLMGLAGVGQTIASARPFALTDAAGKPFWRFEGGEYLDVATSLVTDMRSVTVLMVGRVPRPSPSNRYFGAGNVAAGTQVNTNGAILESRIVSHNAGFLAGYGKQGYSATTNAAWMIPGAQKQVMGMTSGSSGVLLQLNERTTNALGNALNVTGLQGAEIGRYPQSPGSSGAWGQFDLYEMVVYDHVLTAAEMQSVSQALMDSHGIPAIQHQLWLDGDSIMQGTDPVTPALSAAGVLTDPGAGLVPATWRVVNRGASGNVVSDLLTRRDAANGWVLTTLPGRNVMAFEIGRNNIHTIGAAQLRTDVIGFLNTATTGVLQRGWEARVMANIASSPSFMAYIDPYRAMLRDPLFLTDTLSNTGQTYAGKVSIVATDMIEHLGQTIFGDADDATNTTYYAGDVTHPNVLGAQLRVTGGETPHYGVAYGLV